VRDEASQRLPDGPVLVLLLFGHRLMLELGPEVLIGQGVEPGEYALALTEEVTPHVPIPRRFPLAAQVPGVVAFAAGDVSQDLAYGPRLPRPGVRDDSIGRRLPVQHEVRKGADDGEQVLVRVAHEADASFDVHSLRWPQVVFEAELAVGDPCQGRDVYLFRYLEEEREGVSSDLAMAVEPGQVLGDRDREDVPHLGLIPSDRAAAGQVENGSHNTARPIREADAIDCWLGISAAHLPALFPVPFPPRY
jgi:hypothetical protein